MMWAIGGVYRARFTGALVVRIYLQYIISITKIEHENKQSIRNPQGLVSVSICENYLLYIEYGEYIGIYDDGYKAMSK